MALWRRRSPVSAQLGGASLRIGMARYSYYVLGRKRVGIYVLRITYHWPGPNLGRAQIWAGPNLGRAQFGPGPIWAGTNLGQA